MYNFNGTILTLFAYLYFSAGSSKVGTQGRDEGPFLGGTRKTKPKWE